MKLTYLTIIVSVMTLLSCSSKKVESIIDEISDQTDISSKLEYVNIIEDSISSPQYIESFDNNLIVVFRNSPELFKIYNLKDSTIQIPTLIGKGDNEALTIGGISKITPTQFYGFDVLQNKILLYSQVSNGAYKLSQSVRIDSIYNIALVKNGYLASLYMPDSRYLLNINGKRLTFGNFEKFQAENNIGMQLSLGELIVDDNRKRFASFGSMSESFQIIDYSGNSCNKICDKLYAQPIFDIIQSSYVAYTPKSKRCFKALTADDNYIYALYSGNLVSESDKLGSDCNWGQHIFVINWDGDIISHLYSDRLIGDISYNRMHGKMYCIIRDNDLTYKIMSFSI